MRKHLYYLFLATLVVTTSSTIATTAAAASSSSTNSLSETISKKITTDSGHTTNVNVHVTTIGPEGSVVSKCNESKANASTEQNIVTPNPGNVQRLVLTPGKNFLITVDPCTGETAGGDGSANVDFQGIGLPDSVFEASKTDPLPEKIPIVPQKIVPAAQGIELTASEARILEAIEQQPDLEELSAEELNERVKKYINFLNLLRGGAQMNQVIKLPRLVFIGETDENKYSVIEGLIGMKGILEPGPGDLKMEPRFPVPIRFTLLNQNNSQKTVFKIVGGDSDEGRELTGNSLFTALKQLEVIKAAEKAAKLDEKPVEIEIIGPKIPSLVFIDLPWRVTESNQKSESYPILRRLLFKYLEQPWGLSVAVGPASVAYDQWQTLRLMRAFDEKMKRILTVAVDADSGEDVRLQGLVLGLQSGQPTLKSGKMFYLQSASSKVLPEGLCSLVSGCNRDRLLQSLQRRLLRIWYAMRPEAQEIIQKRLNRLKSRVIGYDGFWGEGSKADLEGKFKALVDQATPLLRSRLVFAAEERDSVACSASSLDLIKESIFEDDSNNDNTTNNNNNNNAIDDDDDVGSWNSIFATFQQEISQLPKFPDGISWPAIERLLGQIKSDGPNRAAITEIKQAVLVPQLEALKGVKERLFGAFARFYRRTLKRALKDQKSLEAFEEFRQGLLKASELVLKDSLARIRDTVDKIDTADTSVGWIYNFSTSNFWTGLEGSLEEFQRISGNGFIEICARNAILLPRLLIDGLLKPEAAPQAILAALKASRNDNLTDISVKAVEALKKIEQKIQKTDELIKAANE